LNFKGEIITILNNLIDLIKALLLGNIIAERIYVLPQLGTSLNIPSR
jgi:hypothetical protein